MIEDYFSIQLSGDLRLALPLGHVETVARFPQQVICPIPGVAPFWLGVINQKGSLLWVLDGDLFFELASESAPRSSNLTAVVLSSWVNETQRRTALVVKQWVGVASLDRSQFEPVSLPVPSQFHSLFNSIVIKDNTKYALLDTIALFQTLRTNINFN